MINRDDLPSGAPTKHASDASLGNPLPAAQHVLLANDFDSATLDMLATSIVLIDGDWRVCAINLAGETLLEASASRAMGEPLDHLLVLNNDWTALLAQAQQEEFPMVHRGLELHLRSGQELAVDLTLSPIQRDGGIYLLLELSAVDRLHAISEGENLWEAQQSLRQIIKGLAHEVKNPLGGIRGAAQLLSKELQDANLSEYTDVIMAEADRLRTLVDKMLGPRERLDLRATNIHEVTERVRQLIQAESQGSVSLARDYDPSLPEFKADPDQLTQVLLNIVRNAWQAVGTQGHITLRTRSRRQYTLGGHRHKLVCAVEVIDNGPGIAEDIMPRLFLPMVTGRANGTGLGLSIAQMIANRHGGLIQCHSEPGNTIFTVLLPMEI